MSREPLFRSMLALVLVAAFAVGCDRKQEPQPSAPAPKPEVVKVALSERSSRPEAPRVVAVGDLHGDLRLNGSRPHGMGKGREHAPGPTS